MMRQFFLRHPKLTFNLLDAFVDFVPIIQLLLTLCLGGSFVSLFFGVPAGVAVLAAFAALTLMIGMDKLTDQAIDLLAEFDEDYK